MNIADAIGWMATAVFSISYLCRRSTTLRWVQAGAALIWVVYGLRLHAMPVVAANAIVAIAAGGTCLRALRKGSA
jgi:uncharacterized protein with PQ loop repeat